MVVAAVVSLVAALAGSAAAWAATPKPTYVALGDSFTAGPLIPVQIPPPGCLKSDHNYPHLAAPRISERSSLRDVSCSGAETEDMTQAQEVEGPDNPPQLDALSPDTRIVSLGIGGNDIGFSELIKSCSSPTPTGHPCQDKYVSGDQDEIRDRIQQTGPKVAAVLQGIHTRAPDAAVYVVNYLPILPDSGDGCWPVVPVAKDDVAYLREKEKELNKMLADQAAANGATVVDAYSAGIGHDACQPPTERWVEPTAPVSPAAPFHPNLAGMQGTARVLARTVR
jgi:lysophospholipase L1-like esterase